VPSSLDSDVKEGDNIIINFALDGRDAEPKAKEYIDRLDSVSFYIDDAITCMEPVVIINGNRASLEEIIREGDEVSIVFPNTIEEYRKYFETDCQVKYFISETELEGFYKIKEGDRIIRIFSEKFYDYSSKSVEETEHPTTGSTLAGSLASSNIQYPQIEVLVNGEKVTLKNKGQYIFIDIFDYINFDLTVAKGTLVLQLNGRIAGYHEVISTGDEIKIYWEK
jgi:sulfur carrier protein ThiS